MHNGFVTINGEKMSKSLGNIILTKDLTSEYHGEVIRLALLSTHYRQGLDWNDSIIHQSKKLLDKLYKMYFDLSEIDATEDDNSFSIIDSLLDDLNTPALISNLNKLVKDYSKDKDINHVLIKTKLNIIGSALGILQDKNYNHVSISEELKVKIKKLLSERVLAKEKKDFSHADKIRDELRELGVEIKDSKEGTSWNLIK
jgi:cysteinyl-tRNA synthetase